MSEDQEITAVKGWVSGRVQGVGFRYFVRRNAMALGISGSAINLIDGRVEIVASGDAEAVASLQTAVARGPTLSSVDSVVWETLDLSVSKGFVIG